MNKKLWDTIILDGLIPQGEIDRMMDNPFNSNPTKEVSEGRVLKAYMLCFLTRYVPRIQVKYKKIRI